MSRQKISKTTFGHESQGMKEKVEYNVEIPHGFFLHDDLYFPRASLIKTTIRQSDGTVYTSVTPYDPTPSPSVRLLKDKIRRQEEHCFNQKTHELSNLLRSKEIINKRPSDLNPERERPMKMEQQKSTVTMLNNLALYRKRKHRLPPNQINDITEEDYRREKSIRYTNVFT